MGSTNRNSLTWAKWLITHVILVRPCCGCEKNELNKQLGFARLIELFEMKKCYKFTNNTFNNGRQTRITCKKNTRRKSKSMSPRHFSRSHVHFHVKSRRERCNCANWQRTWNSIERSCKCTLRFWLWTLFMPTERCHLRFSSPLSILCGTSAAESVSMPTIYGRQIEKRCLHLIFAIKFFNEHEFMKQINTFANQLCPRATEQTRKW